MHIALYSNSYKPVVNGVVRSMSSFREALTLQGHNVFIFAQHVDDYQDEEPFVFRYPALELPEQEVPLTIPMSSSIDKLLPALKLDVIHAQHPILLGQTAARKAEELKLPLVFTHHTRYKEYSHYVSLPQEFVKDVIERLVGDYMARCHHVIVPSGSIFELLAKTYGISDQVTVLPTGIDVARFQQGDGQRIRQEHGWGDDQLLMSVGRLAEEKNWRTLIAAMPAVLQQHPRARLVILGGGPDQKELNQFAAKLGIADRVELVGMVPFETVPDYLHAAEMFVFASVSETQGLVTLEAMAAGLPVVAVTATGTADVLTSGVEGLLTDNSSEALAAGIISLLDNDAMRAAFGRSALDRAQDFSIARQAEKLVDVYRLAGEAQQAGRTMPIDKRKPIFTLDLFQKLGFSPGKSK